MSVRGRLCRLGNNGDALPLSLRERHGGLRNSAVVGRRPTIAKFREGQGWWRDGGQSRDSCGWGWGAGGGTA